MILPFRKIFRCHTANAALKEALEDQHKAQDFLLSKVHAYNGDHPHQKKPTSQNLTHSK